jgi:hypothetical protein
MTTKRPTPDSFLPLTPAVFHILLALADEEAHGYAIMQEVAERSEGTVRLGPGTLYGAIGRLLADGLIEEREERPDPEMDDARRRPGRFRSGGGNEKTVRSRARGAFNKSDSQNEAGRRNLMSSDGIYCVLLRLYPRRFQTRFGREMLQVFQDCCREEPNLPQGPGPVAHSRVASGSDPAR